MRMQVKLEIGHKAACRLEPTPEGFTHDWTIFVRGSEGKDISHFVEKVVFHLHESFPRPKRAIKDPPYKLDETGYGSFELKIEVCFKTKDEPRRVNFTYDLFLPLSGYPPVTSVRTEALTFTHPKEDFMRKLVKGGGVPISAVNGVSNGVPNGHPPREEPKEPAPQKNTNFTDGEKSKKIKIPKSSSKPPAVVGMKRSSPSHEQSNTDGTVKKKKKSNENSSKTKHSQNDAVAPLQPLTTEVKDLKVKFRPIPPKESAEKKVKDVSADGHRKAKSSHSSKTKESKSHKEHSDSKRPDASEHKIKVKKKSEKAEKKKNSEKKEKSESKKDKKGIEKVTIRRSSGDSWASAGSSTGLMSNVVAKNKALGKLLSEMSDDDDEEEETLHTPFKREPSPVVMKHKEQISSKSSGLKVKENTCHVDDTTKVENNPVKQQTNKSDEAMKTSSTVENGVKDKNITEGKLSNKELYDLYEQITKCEDSEFLQKVVDVIETTGLYTIAEKTFEFDLCCLEKTTLVQLQMCLNIR